MTLLKKAAEAQPIVGQRSAETQPYGTLTRYLIGLSDEVRTASVSEHVVDTPLVRAR